MNIKKEISTVEIALVISNRKSAYGLERAKQAGISTACIKDQKELLKKLQDEKIDFIVLAGYLAILQEDLIKAYPNKIINIHPSLILLSVDRVCMDFTFMKLPWPRE